ncbi:hypothetical protein K7W42_07640 [Deinococcus sp. HMF7604]|uniref:hypothetical protein n=1 Tax=Deinococcus betulae TaxID=2873312 RepID=UPI001CCA2AA7|nr:hypothetical protein [Deinococcus betulae]MBZ9750731.1 hypothetical protein [Deinococcus betulae]
MPYIKLSEQIEKLTNAQRSDAFIKQFRDAVREGKIDAADLPSRFELPKQFSRRGSDETYSKTVRDMVFDHTPEFDAWFDETNQGLNTGRRGSKPKATLENIEAGLVDFKELAAATRAKIEASYSKGQALGKSRSGGAKKPGRKAKK